MNSQIEPKTRTQAEKSTRYYAKNNKLEYYSNIY